MTTPAHALRPFLLFAVSAALVAGAGNVQAETKFSPAETSLASLSAASESTATQTPFTRELLTAALTRALVAHFNFEGDLQIELLRAWTPPARLASVWDLNVVEFPSVAASSMMVRCRVLADATPISDVTFVVRAQLWRDAWATRQPLTGGSAFDASMLETRRVDLLRERDVLPAAVGDRNFIFTRAVTAGRMLTWRDIARRPLVKKGDLVEVSAVDGPLVVTMKGQALESGAQGETVTVRNPESRKIFAAMVVDENRVQIRF